MPIQLQNLTTGDLVNIKVNGYNYPFRFMVANHPNYGPNTALFLSAQIYKTRTVSESLQTMFRYEQCSWRPWLNEEFYNGIDSSIRTKIIPTKVPCLHVRYYSANSSTRPTDYLESFTTDNIFVPSKTEIGGTYAGEYEQGAQIKIDTGNWIMINGDDRVYYVTRNSYFTDLNFSSQGSFYKQERVVSSTGAFQNPNYTTNSTQTLAFAPMFVLPGNLNVSDTKKNYSNIDYLGESYNWSAYDFVFNSPPTKPSSIMVPDNIMGGSNIDITWGASTDPDGNLSGYRLERKSGNQGSFSQIYSGSALKHTDNVAKGVTHVQYRVKAFDADGAESDYETSPVRTVDNNTAPTIESASSGNLGTKNTGFSISYVVRDAENDVVTVTETLDGVQKRSYTVTLGATNTFDVTGEYFMKIRNGTHTMVITARDSGGKSSALTLTFTKAVHALRITLKKPMTTSALITKMVMNITRNIPDGASFKVLVTNNANDDSVVWEDVTNAILMERNHLFTNRAVAKGHAYNFVITASRAASNTDAYISAVSGAFE